MVDIGCLTQVMCNSIKLCACMVGVVNQNDDSIREIDLILFNFE